MIAVENIKINELYKQDVPIQKGYVGDSIIFVLENYQYTFQASTMVVMQNHVAQDLIYHFDSYKQKIINGVVQEEKIFVGASFKFNSGEDYIRFTVDKDKQQYGVDTEPDYNPTEDTRQGIYIMTQEESNKTLSITFRQRGSVIKQLNSFETDKTLIPTYDENKYSSAIDAYKNNGSIQFKFKVRFYVQKYINGGKYEQLPNRNLPTIKNLTFESKFESVKLVFFPQSFEYKDENNSRCAHAFFYVNRTGTHGDLTLNTKCTMICRFGGSAGGVDYTSHYGYLTVNITDNDINGTLDCYFRPLP